MQQPTVSQGATPLADGEPARRQGVLWPLLLVLAGYLLFSHIGCHGDEDNELFARLGGRPPARTSR